MTSDFMKSAEEMQQELGPALCLAKWQQVSLHLTNGLTNSCYHPPLHDIDVSLLAAPTYYTAKPQPVRNTQELETPMDYNILLNGIIFSFTLWMSAKYLMGCGAAWSNLLQDLRKELA